MRRSLEVKDIFWRSAQATPKAHRAEISASSSLSELNICRVTSFLLIPQSVTRPSSYVVFSSFFLVTYLSKPVQTKYHSIRSLLNSIQPRNGVQSDKSYIEAFIHSLAYSELLEPD